MSDKNRYGMERRMAWCLTTGHMPNKDNDILCDLVGICSYNGGKAKGYLGECFDLFYTDGGWIFSLWMPHDHRTEYCDDIYKETLTKLGLSTDLFNIIDLAARSKVRYLHFDQDADEADFPTHAW